jgi:hypothetical protein
VERRWDLAVTCLLSRRPNVAGIDLSPRVRDAVERRAAPGAHPGVDIMKRKSLQAYVHILLARSSWRRLPVHSLGFNFRFQPIACGYRS